MGNDIAHLPVPKLTAKNKKSAQIPAKGEYIFFLLFHFLFLTR